MGAGREKYPLMYKRQRPLFFFILSFSFWDAWRRAWIPYDGISRSWKASITPRGLLVLRPKRMASNYIRWSVEAVVRRTHKGIAVIANSNSPMHARLFFPPPPPPFPVAGVNNSLINPPRLIPPRLSPNTTWVSDVHMSIICRCREGCLLVLVGVFGFLCTTPSDPIRSSRWREFAILRP